jgi:hypothetical protein
VSSPLVESTIRQRIAARKDRDAKRAEDAAAELDRRQAKDEAEQRSSVSPRDIERQAAFEHACRFWQEFHEQERLREYHRQRNADIKSMANLKAEWDQPETTPNRRGHIVRQYGELYRKYEPKTTDEMLLNYWQSEKRKAALAAFNAKIYGTTA